MLITEWKVFGPHDLLGCRRSCGEKPRDKWKSGSFSLRSLLHRESKLAPEAYRHIVRSSCSEKHVVQSDLDFDERGTSKWRRLYVKNINSRNTRSHGTSAS